MSTRDRITALREEAAAHGDLAQVSLCDRALAGDDAALEACTAVLAAVDQD